ncbi:MAG: hypothetical protein ACI4P3_01115 [Candidatus Spyradosoma sp.]
MIRFSSKKILNAKSLVAFVAVAALVGGSGCSSLSPAYAQQTPPPAKTQPPAPVRTQRPAVAPTPTKPAPQKQAKEEKKTERTVVASNGLSSKIALPELAAPDTRYRPVISIGKETVSGTGTADNGKLEKLGGCVPNSIFVDPEIFNGLSEMQSIALREAIADACRKSGADFLVAPRYELAIASDSDDTAVSCTVTGYPANITDFVSADEEAPEVTALKKELAEKNATIDELSRQIDALKNAKTRETTVAAYLELIRKYGITDMNEIRRILALMGELVPLSEHVPAPGEANVLEVKPGNITLNGNVGVQVPVEVPAIKVKIEK